MQPKTPSTTMAPSAQAILRVSARSWPRRATSGRLIIALIAEAMMAPIPATWGGKVPAVARLAAEATALALETPMGEARNLWTNSSGSC